MFKHTAVTECAVVGRPDEMRGDVVSAFVLLKHGHTASAALRQAILDRDPGDITTIEEEGSVEEARVAWQQMKAELTR